MEKFDVIKTLIEQANEDADKFYNHGNSAAGTRLRKHMQDLKTIAQEVREEVLASRKK